jgi:hypothetical protein
MFSRYAAFSLILIVSAAIADDGQTKPPVTLPNHVIHLANAACSACVAGHGCTEAARACGTTCDPYMKTGNTAAYNACNNACTAKYNSCTKGAAAACGC